MGRISSFLAVAAIALLSAACSGAGQTSRFIRSDKAPEGVYVFELPLEDSLASYDFWFYSRVEETPMSNLRLDVQWLSPSGRSLSETVYMRSVGLEGDREKYRSGMVPADAGLWRLSVRPVGAGDDFCGLGLVYVKNTDGTR